MQKLNLNLENSSGGVGNSTDYPKIYLSAFRIP